MRLAHAVRVGIAQRHPVLLLEELRREMPQAVSQAETSGEQVRDPLPDLARRIALSFARYERHAQECGLARLEAARLLAEAKAVVQANGASFKEWCAVNVRRSWRDVRRLVAIGESAAPREALAAERQRNAVAQRARTARQARTDVSPPPPARAQAAVHSFLLAPSQTEQRSADAAPAFPLHELPARSEPAEARVAGEDTSRAEYWRDAVRVSSTLREFLRFYKDASEAERQIVRGALSDD